MMSGGGETRGRGKGGGEAKGAAVRSAASVPSRRCCRPRDAPAAVRAVRRGQLIPVRVRFGAFPSYAVALVVWFAPPACLFVRAAPSLCFSFFRCLAAAWLLGRPSQPKGGEQTKGKKETKEKNNKCKCKQTQPNQHQQRTSQRQPAISQTHGQRQPSQHSHTTTTSQLTQLAHS